MDKFATFSSNGATFYGLVIDQGMITLSDAFPQYPTLQEVIADGELTALKDATSSRTVTHPIG